MSTINISLPTDHVKTIDAFIDRYGFANRSEFIPVSHSFGQVSADAPTGRSDVSVYYPANTGKKCHFEGICANKKYSKALLKDMKIGLDESSYFAK